MSAQPRTQAAIADSTSARRLIECLARIHPLLVVHDAQGTIRWMSDGFGSLCSDAQGAVGRPLRAMLRKLPDGEQLEELCGCFGERDFLANLRVDLEAREGVRRPLEASV